MTFFSGPNPIFLSTDDMMTEPKCVAQVKVFDVCYDIPLVVGFHVVKEPEEES